MAEQRFVAFKQVTWAMLPDPKDKHSGELVLTALDKPRRKAICAGTEAFCRKYAMEYRQRHPETPGDIEVVPGVPDDFKTDWPSREWS